MGSAKLYYWGHLDGSSGPYAVFSDRPDGLTVRIDLPHLPKQWIAQSVSVTAAPGNSVTTADLERVAKQLPKLMLSLSTWIDAESASAAVAETGDAGDLLSQVASVYNQAVENHQRPVLAVMERLNMKRSMANRRIRAAKDAGLIAVAPEEVSE